MSPIALVCRFWRCLTCWDFSCLRIHSRFFISHQVIHIMLSGKRPFTPGPELQTRIMSGIYRPLDCKEWVSISKAVKHLVKKLLEVDPGARLSTSQKLDHPWFVEDEGSVKRGLCLGRSNLEKSKWFSSSHLTSQIYTYISHPLSFMLSYSIILSSN